MRDLGYFLAVAELGNVALAARRCHVTQPAISKSIRRIEETLALQLFQRSRQGMALTASGDMFRLHALRIRREHEDAMQHAVDLRDGLSGLLRLGSTRPVYDAVVAPTLVEMFVRRPKLRLRLELGAADDLLELLLRGELDMVCAPVKSQTHSDLDFREFGADHLAVLAAKNHPAFALAPPTLKALVAWPWVLPQKSAGALQWFHDQFHRAGIAPPEPALEVDYAGVATLSIIAATHFLLFTPVGTAQLAAPGVRRLPVPDLDTRRRLYVVTRRDAYRSAVMTFMIQMLAR